jgi:hypothetical protein
MRGPRRTEVGKLGCFLLHGFTEILGRQHPYKTDSLCLGGL